MSYDQFSRYEAGLDALLHELRRHRRHHGAALDEALVCEHLLGRTIEQARLYGDREIFRVERAQILERLNRLTQAYLGLSFDELSSRSLMQNRVGSKKPPFISRALLWIVTLLIIVALIVPIVVVRSRAPNPGQPTHPPTPTLHLLVD
jgi:hypothetical protein